MYAETIEVVNWLEDLDSYPEKEGILPPEQFKSFVFNMYNKLLLKKQEEE